MGTIGIGIEPMKLGVEASSAQAELATSPTVRQAIERSEMSKHAQRSAQRRAEKRHRRANREKGGGPHAKLSRPLRNTDEGSLGSGAPMVDAVRACIDIARIDRALR